MRKSNVTPVLKKKKEREKKLYNSGNYKIARLTNINPMQNKRMADTGPN